MLNKNLSIIIPCYNCEDYIERTIDSILIQYSDDIELIIVNDGSTDDSINKINRLLKGKNISYKLITQENKGVSAARNTGIMNAEGKYIYFLDSDDYIDSEFIYNIKKIIDEDLDAIVFGYDYVCDNKVLVKYKNDFENINEVKDGNYICTEYLKQEINIHICSFIIKKSILLQNKIFFREKCFYGEDIEFIIKSLINCKRIKTINKTLFYYYDRDNSVMKNFSDKRFTGLDAIQGIKDYLISEKYNEYEQLKQLVEKRFVKEIIYIYQGLIYFNKDKKNESQYNEKIDDIVRNNFTQLKEFKADSSEDKIIARYCIFLIVNHRLFKTYKRTIFMLKRTIKYILNKETI